jgi:L-alanine-DL-glutamate epimerase-like enolase superfamily enzyme
MDMVAGLRNLGGPGISAMAVSVLDTALWDWKARRLGISLAALLGPARDAVPAYGSGGFTSYEDARLQAQLAGWHEAGLQSVKMKVGREPECDAHRVAMARQAIGPQTGLMVDANGAYTAKQALHMARQFAQQGVEWLEEPVSSEDLAGLRLIRERAPPGMDVAAGEYGHDACYFERMLSAGAVDVLQADATRCGGVTGFMKAAAVCEAHGLPLSSHCAPALHAQLMCAAQRAMHLEYFHDHVRIEAMLFDGVPALSDGRLVPDRSRPGLGLDFKHKDAECFKVM